MTHSLLLRAGGLLLLALALPAPAVLAQPAPRTTLADGAVGRVHFHSHTPASQRPLITRSYLEQAPVVISGDLSLPATSTLARDGRLPAVVLAHGTGGVSSEREHAWARRFASWGIAAFIVDSYAGRGLKPPMYADRPGFTHMAAHLVDAFRALELLATHPRIDASRIAVMGFSRGGEVALNAIFDRFRKGALGDAPLRFAAYIPFYPYCNFRHVSASLAKAPLLMLLGGADEMTEPGPCERHAERLREQGVAVRLIVYPGVHHGFDRLRPVALDPNFVGIRRCEAVYDVDTMAVHRLDTAMPMARQADFDQWVAECRHRGARFGGDDRARAAAIVEVRAFLLEVLAR